MTRAFCSVSPTCTARFSGSKGKSPFSACPMGRATAASIPNCPMCGTRRTINELIDYYEFCGVRGEEAPGPSVQVPEITPRDLKTRLDRGDDLFILDVREPHEYQICNLKGHLI